MVYEHHGVRNMFKTDLLSSLCKKGCNLIKVTQAIQEFTKTCLFIRCYSVNNMTICELEPSELDKALKAMFEGEKRETL